MHKSRSSFKKFTILFLILSSAVIAVSVFGVVNPETASADSGCMTFKETTFQICGRFLQYWTTHGGLAQQGFPISAAFDEKNAPPPAGDGAVHTVQYFERARFEFHPENQYPNDVLLGLLGSEQVNSKYGGKSGLPVGIDPGGHCETLQDQGYSVCGKFLDYWKQHGGLAQQGYPISNVFVEQNAPPPAGDGKQHRVQYFERARFEEHTENTPPNDTELGLLGSEQKAKKYSNGTPSGGTGPVVITIPTTPTPTPTPAPEPTVPVVSANYPLNATVREYLVPGTKPSALVAQILAEVSIYNPTNHNIAVGQDTFFLTTKDGSVYKTSPLIYSDPTFGFLAMRGLILSPGEKAFGFMMFLIDRGSSLDQFVFFDGVTKLTVNFAHS